MKWLHHAEELRAWVAVHGRLPLRKATDVEEKRLSAWLGSLQQKMKTMNLSEEQVQILEEIPGMHERLAKWTTSPRLQNWPTRCGQLSRWVQVTDRLPKRNAEDTREKSLAQFLSATQQKERWNELTSEQRALLRRIPYMEQRMEQWNGSDPRISFVSQLCIDGRPVKKRRGELPPGRARGDD